MSSCCPGCGDPHGCSLARPTGVPVTQPSCSAVRNRGRDRSHAVSLTPHGVVVVVETMLRAWCEFSRPGKFSVYAARGRGRCRSHAAGRSRGRSHTASFNAARSCGRGRSHAANFARMLVTRPILRLCSAESWPWSEPCWESRKWSEPCCERTRHESWPWSELCCELTRVPRSLTRHGSWSWSWSWSWQLQHGETKTRALESDRGCWRGRRMKACELDLSWSLVAIAIRRNRGARTES